jgi:hypothetical protein
VHSLWMLERWEKEVKVLARAVLVREKVVSNESATTADELDTCEHSVDKRVVVLIKVVERVTKVTRVEKLEVVEEVKAVAQGARGDINNKVEVLDAGGATGVDMSLVTVHRKTSTT